MNDKKKALITLAIAVPILALIVFYIFKKQVVEASGDIQCEKIQITIKNKDAENLLLDENGLLNLLSDFHLLEKKMWEISIKEVEQTLWDSKIFSKVQVYQLNATLCIEVTEREPICLVLPDDIKHKKKHNMSQPYYVTTELMEKDFGLNPQNRDDKAELYTIPHRSDFQALELPVITGLVTKPFATLELAQLIKSLEQHPRYQSFFKHIYVDPVKGVILRIKDVPTQIIFGYATNWDTMLNKLKIFEEEVIARKGWDKFKTIRFEFNQQVVAQEK